LNEEINETKMYVKRKTEWPEWVKRYGLYRVHVVKLDNWHCDVRDASGATIGKGSGWNLSLAIRRMHFARTGRGIVRCLACDTNPVDLKALATGEKLCPSCRDLIFPPRKQND
jgi:hypothetical protein